MVEGTDESYELVFTFTSEAGRGDLERGRKGVVVDVYFSEEAQPYPGKVRSDATGNFQPFFVWLRDQFVHKHSHRKPYPLGEASGSGTAEDI